MFTNYCLAPLPSLVQIDNYIHCIELVVSLFAIPGWAQTWLSSPHDVSKTVIFTNDWGALGIVLT